MLTFEILTPNLYIPNKHQAPNLNDRDAPRLKMTTDTHRRALIGSLLIAYAFFGIAMAIISADEPAVSSAILFGLVSSQATLLGMWGGLGSTHWLLRLVCVTAGTIVVYIELAFGIDEFEDEIFVLVALSTLLSGILAVSLRLMGMWVGGDAKEHPGSREGLQFTIRHLLIWTFVVACLVTIGKYAKPRFRSSEMYVIITTLSVGYAAVAISALWAVLGKNLVAARCLVSIIIAVIAGYAGALVIGNLSMWETIFWMACSAIQSLAILASLAVVRMAGYRLLRRGDRTSGDKHGREAAAELSNPFKPN